jgi:beta-glucosidase
VSFVTGWGLSYSNFTFSNVQLTASDVPSCTSTNCTVTADDTFTISLDITNHGRMAGKTVVQVYFSQDLCSRVRFSNMLLGFEKVEVEGDTTSKGVKVPLKARELEMWDKAANKYVVEDADYTLQVGQWVADPRMKHVGIHVRGSESL